MLFEQAPEPGIPQKDMSVYSEAQQETKSNQGSGKHCRQYKNEELLRHYGEEILDTTERSTDIEDIEDEALTKTILLCDDDNEDDDELDDLDFEDSFVLKRRSKRKKLSLQERLARRERNSFWRQKRQGKLESDDDSESDEYDYDFAKGSNKTTHFPSVTPKNSSSCSISRIVSTESVKDSPVTPVNDNLGDSSSRKSGIKNIKDLSSLYSSFSPIWNNSQIGAGLLCSTEDFFTAISTKLDWASKDKDEDLPMLLCEVCGIDVEMATTTIKRPHKCSNLIYCSPECLQWDIQFGNQKKVCRLARAT